MDEPSEGLAPAIIEMLIETFKKLEQEGLRILLVPAGSWVGKPRR